MIVVQVYGRRVGMYPWKMRWMRRPLHRRNTQPLEACCRFRLQPYTDVVGAYFPNLFKHPPKARVHHQRLW